MLRILLVVILFLSVLDASNNKITLQLNWKYQYEFAGYIAAIEKGFYKEAGIDVIVKEYDNNTDVVGDVLSGKSDLGVYGSSLVEIGAKNENLVLIANYFKRSALVIVGNKDILTPNDLIGKKVMAGGYELDNTSLATLLKKFGISKSDFTILPHTFRIDEFVNGEVDAMTAFVSNQLYFLQQKNINYNVIDPTNYGVFGFEHNLFSNKVFASKNQDLIRDFVDATKKGWNYALENPLEVSGIIYNKYSKAKPIDALLFEANQIKKLMMPNVYSIGSIDNFSLEKYVNDLKNESLVDKNFNVKNILFTYIDSQNDLFTIEQMDYLENKKEIIMCVDPDWMPYEKIENGKHVGLAADYFEVFQSKLNIPIRVLITNTWDESLQKAKNRECDILSLAVSTPVRREYMNFTKPYISYPLVIVTTMDKLFVTDIESIITQEKIGVVKGYAPYDIYSKKFPDHKLVQVDNLKMGLDMVRRGELYGFIDTLPTVGYEIQRHYISELKIAGKFEDMWQLGIAVRNDDAVLLSIFDRVVESISIQEANEIANKWFSVIYEEKIDFKYIWEIIVAVFLIFLLFAYRQSQLKKHNDELNQKLIDSTMEAIFIFDNSVCIDVNIVTVNMLGYESKEELVGKTLADFVAPSSVEKVKQYFRESIVTPYEIEVLKKDGSTFPALVQGRFIELGGKQIRISTALDLSEIKQRDKLLFQQSKMASMGEMIGNIAHQWRQPLSVISTIATGLKFQIEFDTFDKKEAMGDLDSLNNTVQYLSKTIDDFRNFFKSNKFKTEFNLSEAIQKDVNLLSATLKNNFIRLGLDLDNSLEISGYRSELTQAILNILNNAKDALIENDVNEDDRVVLIRTYKKQNTAVIEIADSGGGINEQIADKIFEPYFTTKHQSQGTGIGLYMTYEIIVKSFGGHIGVKNKDFIYENKPYFGAIFRILLPMSENHNA